MRRSKKKNPLFLLFLYACMHFVCALYASLSAYIFVPSAYGHAFSRFCMHCMQSIPELCLRIACIVGFLMHTMHTTFRSSGKTAGQRRNKATSGARMDDATSTSRLDFAGLEAGVGAGFFARFRTGFLSGLFVSSASNSGRYGPSFPSSSLQRNVAPGMGRGSSSGSWMVPFVPSVSRMVSVPCHPRG